MPFEIIEEETPIACFRLNPDGIDAFVVQECFEAREDLLFIEDELVKCLVCDSQISLEGRRNRRVVKCAICQEGTPILLAPPGKTYVRCNCNCLILCAATLTKVRCPRINCRRIITLVWEFDGLPLPQQPNKGWVACCFHCHESFLCGLSPKAMVKCYHCRRRSSIGGYSEEQARFWLRLAIISLIINYLLLIPLIIWCPLEFLSIWFLLFLPTIVFIGKTLKFTYRVEVSPTVGFVERQRS